MAAAGLSHPWTLPVQPKGSATCSETHTAPSTRTATASRCRWDGRTGTRRYAASTSAFQTAGAASSSPASMHIHRTSWST
eukprot:3180635-Alexandrium_andersonii.AAC.1